MKILLVQPFLLDELGRRTRTEWARLGLRHIGWSLCAGLLLLACSSGSGGGGSGPGADAGGDEDLAPFSDAAGYDLVPPDLSPDSGEAAQDAASPDPQDAGWPAEDLGPAGGTIDLGPGPFTPVGSTEREADWLFDAPVVPALHLALSPADLAWLYTEAGRYAEEDRRATRLAFVREGQVTELGPVGVRARGNGSREKGKLPYKLSFRRFEAQRLFGLNELNLNPDTNDPTLARRYLTHWLLRRLGLPTSRVGHVRLYVNGYYLGLYQATEHVDERFVRRAFGDETNGPLFKCLWPAPLTETTAVALQGARHSPYGPRPDGQAYDLKEFEDEATAYEALARLTSRLAGQPDEAALRGLLDVDGLVPHLAVQALVGHWDGYWTNQQNYYLYQSPRDGIWRFIEYDTDNTFGLDYIGYRPTWDLERWAFSSAPGWAAARPATRPLAAPVVGVLAPAYRDALQTLAARFFDPASPDDLVAEAYRVRDRIRPALVEDATNLHPWRNNTYGATEGDMYGWTVADFEASYGPSFHREPVFYGLEEFVRAMRTQVTRQLD